MLMHQQVDESYEMSERDALLVNKHNLMEEYRAAVKWACYALEYKRRFDREEDFGTDDIQGSINFLRKDSRRELKHVSTHIKVTRKAIKAIDKRLMDLAGQSNEEGNNDDGK